MIFTWMLLGLLFLNSKVTQAFVSAGVYSISDEIYDGAIYDGTADVYNLGFIYPMHSDDMYSVSSARECKRLCLQKNCFSYVIDRVNRACYISSLDRCNNAATNLRIIPNFITYEIVQGDQQPENSIKKTCFQQCLDASGGNCPSCGRVNCVGSTCEECRKTCWELSPTITSYTSFWPNMALVVSANCYNEWQSAFKNGSWLAYDYMTAQSLWLEIVVTITNGTILTSYFDLFNVTWLTTLKINVGNYLGGTAGNAWNAPTELIATTLTATSNCYPFFYKYDNCSIPASQIPSIANQTAQGRTIFTRGYAWNFCNRSYGSEFVMDMELRVTPFNSNMNSTNFLGSLSNPC